MKNLKWRLSKLPTVEEITNLITSKIITQEEARGILFSLETEETRDKKSLESEIKFLREMVEKLSNRAQIVEVIKEIQPIYRTYPWYDPYKVWCGTASNSGTVTASANNAIYTGTGGSLTATYSANSFSDIKTF